MAAASPDTIDYVHARGAGNFVIFFFVTQMKSNFSFHRLYSKTWRTPIPLLSQN